MSLHTRLAGYDLIAKLVSHLTFNQGCPGSIPGEITEVKSFADIRCVCGKRLDMKPESGRNVRKEK